MLDRRKTVLHMKQRPVGLREDNHQRMPITTLVILLNVHATVSPAQHTLNS